MRMETMMNNLGFHVYESNAAINWETEMVTINLMSALSWKKHQGPIKLYCNTDYYNILKKWKEDSKKFARISVICVQDIHNFVKNL